MLVPLISPTETPVKCVAFSSPEWRKLLSCAHSEPPLTKGRLRQRKRGKWEREPEIEFRGRLV